MLHQQEGRVWVEELVFDRDRVAGCEIGFRDVYRLLGLENTTDEVPIDLVG